MDKAQSSGMPSLREIRHLLGKNQREMAAQLGVSLRAIQSYEQEWRSIPPHLHRISLLLLKLHLAASQSRAQRKCWEIRGCTPEQRADCPAGNDLGGHFCWLVSGVKCAAYHADAAASGCAECPVMHSWLPATPAKRTKKAAVGGANRRQGREG
jgi:DNA-binding XRE family transcriptional regulator